MVSERWEENTVSPTSIPVLNSESYQGVVQGGETQEAPKGHPELRRCSREPGAIKAVRDHRTKYYRGDSCTERNWKSAEVSP